MKIGIIQFPGSNCERETMMAVRRVGMTPIEFLWNESLHKLEAMDAYILVGGFSYEDRSRAGIIAALDPLMKMIQTENKKNKPVLGICNGAQILVETGLVPGLKNNQLGVALTENKRVKDGKILGTGFYNNWVNVCLGSNIKANAFTSHLKKDSILSIPIAHAQGRFLMPKALLNEIEEEGMAVFKYCDDKGHVLDDFPVNPNGSMHNLAALMNPSGNVLAIMPHPERTPIGDPLFASMRDYIVEAQQSSEANLMYSPKPLKLRHYKKKLEGTEWRIGMRITDNEALTVQNTLKQMGLAVEVRRQVHWQIDSKDLGILHKIKETGLLYNERKEVLLRDEVYKTDTRISYLVRSKEDLLGQETQQMLHDHFGFKEVQSILHGILWIFTCETNKIEALKEAISKTNIISNPYAHDCYEYT